MEIQKLKCVNLGQQQLLLIVLGVIVVGIAIVVGINLFSASSVEANKENMIVDLTNIGSMAQQYYMKLVQVGGGSRSFVGFTIPSNIANSVNGTYSASGASSTQITLTGKGNVTDSDGKVYQVVVLVTDNSISTSSITKVSP